MGSVASTMQPLTSGSQVCAVLVSYHPDAELPLRVARALREVGALVIVDNGSSETALAMLRLLGGDPRISLIFNFANLGIAQALNLGIARAKQLGYEWVLLLDQDSLVDQGMVAAMLEVRAAYPASSRVAVLGAGFRDVNKDRADEQPASGGEAWEEVESVITSGSLIPLAIHDLLGAFREEFFIDYVDSDYCFRARARGFRIIKTRRALMSHAIGAATWHRGIGVDKWTSNHSADRRYYIARNDTVMLREHAGYRYGLWALKSLGRRLRDCRRVLLYEQAKMRKLAGIFGGWWDGVRGRLGPRLRHTP
jgi:rhamnosyltransferase